jgi:hypothetical protein
VKRAQKVPPRGEGGFTFEEATKDDPPAAKESPGQGFHLFSLFGRRRWCGVDGHGFRIFFEFFRDAEKTDAAG